MIPQSCAPCCSGERSGPAGLTSALDEYGFKRAGWIEPDVARDPNRKESADSHGSSVLSVRSASAWVRPRLTAAKGLPRLAARSTKRKPEKTIREGPTISMAS